LKKFNGEVLNRAMHPRFSFENIKCENGNVPRFLDVLKIGNVGRIHFQQPVNG